MIPKPLTVAWISQFPVEWLLDIPQEVQKLPRQHPATWQRVLLAELESDPTVRLHIFALRKDAVKSTTFERKGVTFHLIKHGGGLRAPTAFWTDTWIIRRELRTIRPDVVHAWGTERGAGLVASRLDYPFILTMQGLLTWLSEMIPLDLYHRFASVLERSTLRRASLVTVESAFGVKYLKEHYPHLDLHQLEHAPLPLFHKVPRNPQKQPLRFLFVGTLSYGKGTDVLLKALDQFKEQADFELVAVDTFDSTFAKNLRSVVSPGLWQKIRFTGSLTSQEIANELAIATMMLYPTRCDNSPNAVKEAVVAGVPVVACRIGGIVDYVWPDRNGILCQPSDVGAFLSAIRHAWKHPLFSQGAVDITTLNEARSYLSAQRMHQRFVDLYRLAASVKS